MSWEKCPSLADRAQLVSEATQNLKLSFWPSDLYQDQAHWVMGGGRRRLTERRCTRLWGKRYKLMGHLPEQSGSSLVSLRNLPVMGT